jgi:NAD(P)-dependent dehydrogenase (short-subunit alcohol dehydrogenase family)
MKLTGQVAIIVGGARGIGAAIAHTFSQEGASLILVDLEKMKRELDAVAQAISQKGGKAVLEKSMFSSTAPVFAGRWWRCKTSRRKSGMTCTMSISSWRFFAAGRC